MQWCIQNGDGGTLSSQGTVLAGDVTNNHNHQSYHALPYLLAKSVQRITYRVWICDCLYSPPNVFQQDNGTYHDRLRNGKQSQDGLMTEPYMENQNVAVIDDMARHQLGFGL
jgi:hypothetical protein